MRSPGIHSRELHSNEITNTTTFTADPSGETKIAFDMSGVELRGQTFVIYEYVTETGIVDEQWWMDNSSKPDEGDDPSGDESGEPGEEEQVPGDGTEGNDPDEGDESDESDENIEGDDGDGGEPVSGDEPGQGATEPEGGDEGDSEEGDGNTGDGDGEDGSTEREHFLIVMHEDIEAAEQTIYYPAIGTEAHAKDGGDLMNREVEEVITDVVRYENLVVGEEYKVVGTLMNKITGEELCDRDNAPVTAETTFIPGEESGEVEVVFEFDGTIANEYSLAEFQIVVFEELYYEDTLIAEHKDIEDMSQTLHVADAGLADDLVTTGGDDIGQLGDIKTLLLAVLLIQSIVIACILRQRQKAMLR